MKYTTITILIGQLITFSLSTMAAPYKDPRTRDEDISATTTEVKIEKNSIGNYVYRYTIKSPDTNIGRISRFHIDLSCSEALSPSDNFVGARPSVGLLPTFSEDGKHVPVLIDANYGAATSWAITGGNEVYWGIYANPGSNRSFLTLESSFAPGLRQYKLVPSLKSDPRIWDYSLVQEGDFVPWIEDFTVTGIIKGPACPGEELPPEEPELFAGSLEKSETEVSNNLLTYEAPLQNRFHLATGSSSVTMIVHYAKNIDASSFKVQPQRLKLRHLFNPVAGTSQTVTLPLELGKNKIILEAFPIKTPPGKNKNVAEPAVGHGSIKDRDVFEIRVGDQAGNKINIKSKGAK